MPQPWAPRSGALHHRRRYVGLGRPDIRIHCDLCGSEEPSPEGMADDLSIPECLKVTPEQRKAAWEALKINNRWLAGVGRQAKALALRLKSPTARSSWRNVCLNVCSVPKAT